MVSQQLVEQWRIGLAAWQRRLSEGRPRPWLARAYVRVLSYLLAQYAGEADRELPIERTEPAASVDVTPTSPRSTMRFVVAAPDLLGKEPRTRTAIRSVLEGVQRNVPHAEAGPLLGGLRPNDLIVVTSFYSLVEIVRLAGMLEAHGIACETQRLGQKIQLLVRMTELQEAKPIVARHAVDVRDSHQWRSQTVHRYLAMGIYAGLAAGTLLAVFIPAPFAAFLVSRGTSPNDAAGAAFLLAMGVVTMSGSCGGLLAGIWRIVATHKHWRFRKRLHAFFGSVVRLLKESPSY